MRPGWIEKWTEIRARGKWHYVARIGVSWGLIMACALSLWDWLKPANLALLPTPQAVGLNFLLYPLPGGMTFGLLAWYLNERLYRKHTEADPPAE
jgi:hypothetical protein